MFPILPCWPAKSEVDDGGMAADSHEATQRTMCYFFPEDLTGFPSFVNIIN